MADRLTSDSYHSIVHRALGAQVLRAALGEGTDVLYVSPRAMPTGPVRGGVPVLFPQFADTGPLAKHGFVRNAHWSLQQEQRTPAGHQLEYGLQIAPHDHPQWPYSASLRLAVQSGVGGLIFSLKVDNTGNSTFAWTGGLHPYFAVQDLLVSSASGLGGLAVQDRYNPAVRCEEPGQLCWTSEPFERLYDACPPLILHTGKHILQLTATGFDQWMVWNPGQAAAKDMADLPDADWQRFVCIEPVCVTRPVVLAPGQSFEGSLRVAMTLRPDS